MAALHLCYQQVSLKFTVNLSVRPNFISDEPQQGFSKRPVTGKVPFYASTFRKCYSTVALSVSSVQSAQIILLLTCISSGGPRLQWRCICLSGANDLEDQRGHKGQKMTSDPTTPLSSGQLPASTEVQEACTCSHRVKVRVSGESLGQTDAFSTRSLSLSLLLPVELNERTASPFKAIGAQINSVFICLLIFLFFLMLIKMYFCLFHRSPLKASKISKWNLFYRSTNLCCRGIVCRWWFIWY